MNGSSLHSLGSSYYPPVTTKVDNPDKDFKKAKKLPLPSGLRDRLPFPETPWKINTDLFKRLQFPPSSTTEKYHKLELTPSSPESGFVHLLFNHDRPKNRSIRRIHCMHNPNLTRGFETNLLLLEDQASNPVFAPNLDKETDIPLRKQTLQRWQSAATLFSPFQLEVTSRKTQELTKTYILPLWHGTSKPVCESIANTGFTYFGKHAYQQDKVGDGVSTDIGYFGSGIYFTNSARYCSATYGKEHMLLNWVSMRQPFPVVADHPAKSSDDEPKDKQMLKGRGAYKNYNAHYIPVLKVRTPSKPTVHYPCAQGQQAQYDEIVVFKEQQALPRFWVELAVDLPMSPSSSLSSSPSSSSSSSSSSSPSQTLGSLLDRLYELLENPAIEQEKELHQFLESYIQALLSEDLSAPLSSQYFSLANSISRLLDQSGKVRRVVAQSLLSQGNKEKERKKISIDPVSVPKPLPSGVRLLEPEKWIRFLLSIPSLVPSTHVSQEQPVITDKVVTYLNGRSAIRLLTSCRHLRELSLIQALYALLLRRDFPALYRPLASRVSKQTQAEPGLLWQRLYALSHGPDPEPQVLRGHTGNVSCLAPLADGRIASGADDNTVRIWPLDGSPPTVLKGHRDWVDCLAQLTDGRIASGAMDNTVRIWPLDGSPPTVLKGHADLVYCLTQLADGRIASGDGRGTVRIWPLDGSPSTVLKGHTDVVWCLKQLVDGRIASGSRDKTVRIWPLNGSAPTVLRGHTDVVWCLKQLVDGRIASGSEDGTVWIWPLDGSTPTVLRGRTGSVKCLMQLADGRIASGSEDGTVRIWPLDGSTPTVLKGHTSMVSCLTQLTDGRIASGSRDHTVRIWPLDGSTRTVLKGHTNWVTCLTQLRDGRIASGSQDHTVRIWGKDPDSLFQKALPPKAIVTKAKDTEKHPLVYAISVMPRCFAVLKFS